MVQHTTESATQHMATKAQPISVMAAQHTVPMGQVLNKLAAQFISTRLVDVKLLVNVLAIKQFAIDNHAIS
jgi:hypothetical protein